METDSGSRPAIDPPVFGLSSRHVAPAQLIRIEGLGSADSAPKSKRRNRSSNHEDGLNHGLMLICLDYF